MAIVVVIVNYNSGALLQRCLNCLEAQTRQPDDIVIVDNNSEDSFSTKVLESLPDKQVIRLDNNVGYGAAINVAASRLEEEDLLCCLNPDAFPEPQWLERLESTAAKYPQCGSYASLMLKDGEPGIIDGAGDALHFSGFPWRRKFGKRLDEESVKDQFVFSACAGAALYRMTAFRSVGGFDPDYFMYIEDVDLGFRMQLAGYPCRLVSDAIVYHIGSAISGEDSKFSVYHGHRNLIRNYLKNMPLLLLLLTFPFHILASVVSLLILSRRGHFRTICKAKLDGFAMAFDAIKERSKEPSAISWLQIWELLEKRVRI